MRAYLLRLLMVCVLGVIVPAWSAQAPDPVVTALQDELQRALTGLKIDGQPVPYYIACQLDDTSSRNLTARLGEIAQDSSGRGRVLRVEVRVGNYEFDSSRFVSAGGSAADAVAAPLDDDYDVLRRQVWLLADAAYKRAVNVFARK